MNKAKKILYTMAAGAVVGVALGVLFAPEKGEETRKKLRKLKNKLSCGSDLDNNKKALEELSDVLETELSLVNEKIEKLS